MPNRKKKDETTSVSPAIAKQALAAVKIGDLPEHTNLQQVKVKLPDHIYKASSLPRYGVKNKPVYLQGWAMGDFFVKTDLKSSQIYPMFWSSVPSDIQDWVVVD